MSPSTSVGMPAAIRLAPGDARYVADAGETLLDAGRRAGFTFPAACRNGNCFRCEARLLSGEVVNLRSGERTRAAPGAVAADAPGVLPCVVCAAGPCTLEAEGVLAAGEAVPVTVAAQVVAADDISPGILRATLRLPAGKPLRRFAGQYLEILDGSDAFAFSIASPPESGRDLELHVRHGADNPSSLRVAALLRTEKVLTLRLPMGDCTLVGEPRLPLVLVAGSTGFAQVQAFVEHAIAQRWQVPIAVYWGARSLPELYLRERALQWPGIAPNVRVTLAVSQETDALPAGVRSGLVQDAVLADIVDPGNCLVYACGSPAMVYALQDALEARGLPADRLFSDVFAWAPRR